jgi:hypothetical protein
MQRPCACGYGVTPHFATNLDFPRLARNSLPGPSFVPTHHPEDLMATPNDATQDPAATKQRPAKTPANAGGARKATPSRDGDQRARTVKEDKDRSDWEGMNPRPEQGSDDVAAPGEVPRDPR